MAVTKFKVTREVTQNECSWLSKDFHEGDIVYDYLSYTYGCISPTGLALCEDPEGLENPFFEFPQDAVEIVN